MTVIRSNLLLNNEIGHTVKCSNLAHFLRLCDREEVMGMPFGRGRNWFGRGFWKWGAFGLPGPYGGYGGPYAGYAAYGGYGARGWGMGRGRGNRFPFCRWFPWLPRGRWAMPGYGYGGYPVTFSGRYGAGLTWPGYASWGITPGV